MTADAGTNGIARERTFQAFGKSNSPPPILVLTHRSLLAAGTDVRTRPPLPHRQHLLPTPELRTRPFLAPSTQDFAKDVVGHHRANTLDDDHNNDDHLKTITTTDPRARAVARDGTTQAAGTLISLSPAPALAERVFVVADADIRARPPLPHQHPLCTTTERLSEDSLMSSELSFVENDVKCSRTNTFDSVLNDDDLHETTNVADPRKHVTAREGIGQAAGKSNLPCPPLAHADRVLVAASSDIQIHPPLSPRHHLSTMTEPLSDIPLIPTGQGFAVGNVERSQTDTLDNVLDDIDLDETNNSTGPRTHTTTLTAESNLQSFLAVYPLP
ncbi:hypothetical protein Hypma_014435 [Hypsizygus marmoreus]|uniref:Uncharacterized protein n=1 Tax=Hypsizygus marmoreus TaxID=39966 RepID=A0A369JEY2_HYPMA|nr:hypothetical protein Hypma_014435 [Hypsizygus marmoreus]